MEEGCYRRFRAPWVGDCRGQPVSLQPGNRAVPFWSRGAKCKRLKSRDKLSWQFIRASSRLFQTEIHERTSTALPSPIFLFAGVNRCLLKD